MKLKPENDDFSFLKKIEKNIQLPQATTVAGLAGGLGRA